MIRTTLTLLAALAVFTLPARAEINIKETTSPGGIEAWLVEEHAIPFIALEIKFRGGAGLDTPDKLGAVHLMTVLLEEGAGDRDAREFARARDSLASSISFSVNHDTISVSARFLTENTEETMALLRDALTAPQFSDEALERVRAQVISVIQSDLKDPEELANLYYYRDIFGEHPYAFPMNGTLETVAALTRDDLVEALNKAITRDRVYVGAVGDITAEELGTLLDTLLEGLPESGPELPQMAEHNLPGGVHVYDFETPQSVVRFAQPGIDRDHPDFFAAFVLNHILGGGGFDSRLMTEVREKRGLTYGIYSYLSLPDYSNLLAGGTASANDRVAETIRVVREEWARMRDEGVTEEELRDAQTYLTGAYPLRFDGNGPIASIAVNMQLDDLGTDYIRTRNDKVNAVTLEQINRVARELLDPDKLTFFVVGQPEGLETETQ